MTTTRLPLPQRGRPSDVVGDLIDEVSEIIEDDHVREFYLGRGRDGDERAERHSADAYVVLYDSRNAEHSVEVEEALIEEFLEHDKCTNEQPHVGGGASRTHEVYVALWWVADDNDGEGGGAERDADE